MKPVCDPRWLMGDIRRLLLAPAQKPPHRGSEPEGGLGSNCISETGTEVPQGLRPFPSEWVRGRPAAAGKAVAGRGQQTTGAFAIRGRMCGHVCTRCPGFEPLGVSAAAVPLRWKSGVPGPSTARLLGSGWTCLAGLGAALKGVLMTIALAAPRPGFVGRLPSIPRGRTPL